MCVFIVANAFLAFEWFAYSEKWITYPAQWLDWDLAMK